MRTVIIGGGLSGLALAEALDTAGQDYLLLEARARLGGRVLSQTVGAAAFDLGPAWFWQGQSRMAALTARLGLQVFEQYADGAQIFEDSQGRVQQGVGFASMQGSLRIAGGMGALVHALVDRLAPERVRVGAAVTRIEDDGDGITVTLSQGEPVQADRVVLALPPRVAAELTYAPAIVPSTLETLQAIPTWMAGQAKVVAVYDEAFWRDAGLSGDATSRFGPMVEVHDASPLRDGPFALFGFIGVPPQGRAEAQVLRRQILAQLVRLFGPSAAQPREILVQDWAVEVFTATDADLAPLYSHPDYGMPAELRGLWEGRLILAGTEVAQHFGGYLEGALEAAEAAQTALAR